MNTHESWPRAYALYGLGGIGKTQVALEYAYRYGLEYRAVFWIGAQTAEQIHVSPLRIATCLDLPERAEADQQRVIAAAQRWLERHGEWLMIWDNLEDLDLYSATSQQTARDLCCSPPDARRSARWRSHLNFLLLMRRKGLRCFSVAADISVMPHNKACWTHRCLQTLRS